MLLFVVCLFFPRTVTRDAISTGRWHLARSADRWRHTDVIKSFVAIHLHRVRVLQIYDRYRPCYAGWRCSLWRHHHCAARGSLACTAEHRPWLEVLPPATRWCPWGGSIKDLCNMMMRCVGWLSKRMPESPPTTCSVAMAMVYAMLRQGIRRFLFISVAYQTNVNSLASGACSQTRSVLYIE